MLSKYFSFNHNTSHPRRFQFNSNHEIQICRLRWMDDIIIKGKEEEESEILRPAKSL